MYVKAPNYVRPLTKGKKFTDIDSAMNHEFEIGFSQRGKIRYGQGTNTEGEMWTYSQRNQSQPLQNNDEVPPQTRA